LLKNKIANKSIKNPTQWKELGLLYTEIIKQEYQGNNCIISAGFVEGKNKPPVDTIYLKLEKDGVDPTVLLLRPDEAATINWVMSGVLWSQLMDEKRENEG